MKDKDQSDQAAALRRQAEARLKAKLLELPLPQAESETQRLLHELQVHQIELEMQNAALSQARDDMEKALEKYADLYDFAPVGYFSLNREGVISAANITGATLLGTERSRLVGRPFGLFVAPETRPNFSAFLTRVFTTPTKATCEAELVSEGKGHLFAQIEAVAGDSGEECRAAVIDISLRRQLEASLETLHADLLARAADLEAANVELEAFNYSVSHDLRGPLTVIAGYCDVASELYGHTLGAQCQGFFQEIQKGVMRMNRLIDTLLNFSSAKRVELHRKKLDLSRIAEEVALTLRVAEPERQVTFRIAKDIIADGDARLLRVVMDNLLGNAWKYSGKSGAPAIEFGLTDVDGKPTYFVMDNGPGFDMTHMEKLFVPFQRIHGTDVEGHGIGLAMVDRIVRRHGGRVWAESKPDKGATFFFTLG